MQFTTLRNVTINTLRSVTSNKLHNLMHTHHLNKCIIDYSFLCKFYLSDSDFNTFRFHITVVKWYKNGIPILHYFSARQKNAADNVSVVTTLIFQVVRTVVKWYKNGIPITLQTGEVLRNPLISSPFYTV